MDDSTASLIRRLSRPWPGEAEADLRNVAIFTGQPDPFFDNPPDAETELLLGMIFAERRIESPFSIGNDLLYLVPHVYYVEKMGIGAPPCQILINIHHHPDGTLHSAAGNVILTHRFLELERPRRGLYLVAYDPVDGYARGPEGSFSLCATPIDPTSGHALKHRDAFRRIASKHTLGDVLEQLHDGKDGLERNRQAFLRYAGEHIQRMPDLQEQLAGLTGPGTFGPDSFPQPYWQTEEQRKRYIDGVVQSLLRV
jgi:hypothetical protein